MPPRNPPKPFAPDPQTLCKVWRELPAIVSEWTAGIERLASVSPAVSLFGSARINEDEPEFATAFAIAQTLSSAGFTVITGGGSGIMRAANQGAFAGKNGLSVGLNLSHSSFLSQQYDKPRDYQDISLRFTTLGMRKMMFLRHSCACVVMSGGLGTLDELFEALAQVRAHRCPLMPIILVGRDFWADLLTWLEKTVVARGLMSSAELGLLQIADTADEVLHFIQDFHNQAREFIAEKE